MQYNTKKALVRYGATLITLLIAIPLAIWASPILLVAIATIGVWFVWPIVIDRRRVWVRNHPKPVPVAPAPAPLGAPVVAQPVANRPTSSLFKLVAWLLGGVLGGVIIGGAIWLLIMVIPVPTGFETARAVFAGAVGFLVLLILAVTGIEKGRK